MLPNEGSHKASNKTNGNSYQRKVGVFKKIILNEVKPLMPLPLISKDLIGIGL
jgi:hypothetical protein